MDGQRTTTYQRITWRRNNVENLNRLSRVYERYRRKTTDRRQTDRQTDGRWHIANVNVSSRSLKMMKWWWIVHRQCLVGVHHRSRRDDNPRHHPFPQTWNPSQTFPLNPIPIPIRPRTNCFHPRPNYLHLFPRVINSAETCESPELLICCLMITWTQNEIFSYIPLWNADAVLRWEFCPSVCLSVRLSNACIVTKRKKATFRFYMIRKNIYPIQRRRIVGGATRSTWNFGSTAARVGAKSAVEAEVDFLTYYTFAVFSERELKFMFAICHRPSVCRLSVCRLSVTFVRPTQAIEIFGNVSTPFGILAIHDLSVKFYVDRPRGTPPSGELNTRGVAEYCDFGPIQRYISETVQGRS